MAVSRDTLALGFPGVVIFREVNDMGHYILSVVNFGGRRWGVERSPNFSAPMVEWACLRKRPNFEKGGFLLPFTEDAMWSLTPPRTFSACKAVTLGDARGGTLSEPKKVAMKLHVNWGMLRRSRSNGSWWTPKGGNLELLQHVGEVVGRRDVCRALDRAPHVPIAGTPTVSMFNEEAQVHPPFPGATIALHVMNAP